MLLRPRQETFVSRACAALKERKQTLGVAPTGAGKTVMLSAIAGRLGGTQLVLQHRDELVEQNERTFKKVNPRAITSLYVADYKRWAREGGTTFSMIQTLARDANLKTMPRLDRIIVDEGHHAVANSYLKVIHHARKLNPDCELLLVTATPSRSDRRTLRTLVDNVADQITLAELIRDGHLVRPRAFVIDVGVHEELDALRPKRFEEFDQAAVERIMNKRAINDKVVEHWREKAGDRQTVVFTSTVQHAKDVAEAFVRAGVSARVVHGDMPDGERKDTLAEFDAGKFQVVVNVAVLTEGWDCLDDETEVLTPAGWKRRGDINIGDAVYGWDHATGDIRECRVLDVGSRPVRSGERMLEIESQHVNIRVTEGHRMFVEKNRRGGFKEVLARDLSGWASEYAIPLSGNADFPGVPLSDDEIRLVAWHTTDGYLTKGGRLEIYQTEDKHSDHIASLIDRLGMKSWSFVRNEKDRGFGNAKPLRTFVIGKRQLGRVYKYLDKNLSQLMMQMSREQFIVFWNELLLGDGEGSRCLCVGRREFADRLNQMAVLRGFASSISVRERPSGTSYRVFVRDKKKLNSLPGDTRSARMNLVPSRSGEMVWCVTNELGTIVTRRRGKVAIVGNCQPVSCVVLLRKESDKSVLIQMVGRGLRKLDPERYPGQHKDDCIILDFGYSLHAHRGLEQAVRVHAEEGGKDCPECAAHVPACLFECPICGYAWPRSQVEKLEASRDSEGVNELGLLDDFVMTEVDLLNQSPYRWEDLFDGAVTMACAFEAWACLVFYQGRWVSVGGSRETGIHLLSDNADRLMSLAAADDFLRDHGDDSAASKQKQWLHAPATEKQLKLLGMDPMAGIGVSRYRATCMLQWKFSERGIRQKVLNRGLRVAA